MYIKMEFINRNEIGKIFAGIYMRGKREKKFSCDYFAKPQQRFCT